MALTESFAVRVDDSSGKNIKTATDAGGDHIQFNAIVDNEGAQSTPESWYATPATAEDTKVVKSSAGRIYELRVINTHTSTLYFMIFDATGTPSGAPVWRGLVPAGAELSESWPDGFPCSTAIQVALSTTALTFTNPSGPYGLFMLGYK